MNEAVDPSGPRKGADDQSSTPRRRAPSRQIFPISSTCWWSTPSKRKPQSGRAALPHSKPPSRAAAALASRNQSGRRHGGRRRRRFLRGRRSARDFTGLTVTVASTHGAGDTFVGTLAARLALGDTMSAALESPMRKPRNSFPLPSARGRFKRSPRGADSLRPVTILGGLWGVWAKAARLQRWATRRIQLSGGMRSTWPG